jgi:hypothetical protein
MSNKKIKKPASITVKLDYPIEWGGEGLVESIELSRPKGKHIKGINRDVGMKQLLEIASKISGKTPGFFDELDAIDCLKVTEVIGDFLDTGRETGKTA